MKLEISFYATTGSEISKTKATQVTLYHHLDEVHTNNGFLCKIKDLIKVETFI